MRAVAIGVECKLTKEGIRLQKPRVHSASGSDISKRLVSDRSQGKMALSLGEKHASGVRNWH